MHQKDIQENDPFGQNGADDEAEADEADEAEKSFLKALLAERALKKQKRKVTGISVSVNFRFIKFVVELLLTLGTSC